MSRSHLRSLSCIGFFIFTIAGCDNGDGPESPQNTPPTACFTVAPDSATTDTDFQFDASCCMDQEDPISTLQVRWDWDGDGTWDTDYSATKAATHRFGTPGTKTVRLEAIDGRNAAATVAKPVTVTIAPPCLITVQSPNGLENWAKGSSRDITWSATANCSPTVKITLLHDGVWCKDIALRASNTGTYRWESVECCVNVSEGYKVRIVDIMTGASDESDLPFRIHLGPCAIQVTSPNGGESWEEGDYRKITWTADPGCGLSVEILLTRAGGSRKHIALQAENSGTYTWFPVEPIDHWSRSYRVRVIDPRTGSYDESDTPFYISPGICTLTIVAPNGEESWTEGTPQEIRWTSSEECDEHVKITLLRDGVWCRDITLGAPNTGTYTWNPVEQCRGLTDGYKIRIRAYPNESADESDAAFQIANGTCAMAVTSPSAGESWTEGEAGRITWTRTVACGPTVKIVLLRDGTWCRDIALHAANTGTYTWNPVVQCDNFTDTYEVQIVDNETGAAAESDGTFQILEGICTITVTAPYYDVPWMEGSSHDIKWGRTPSCGATVNITLLRDGVWCKDIALLVPNIGMYTWNPVEQCGSFTDRYTVMVADNMTGSADDSNAAFSIPSAGGFMFIQPGTFTMGSPMDELSRIDNETQHQVTLTRPFYLCNHEVTQSEWQSVMGWNDSPLPGADLPVERVNWYDTVKYCNERSTRDGYEPVYDITNPTYSGNHITSASVTWNQNANGYRLPTEAEWEYACRAGSTTAFCTGAMTHSGCYPRDPNLNQVGWYCGNSDYTTHDVGWRDGNAWGLYDMHGNVWEWCWDPYGDYEGDVTDPIGPASGDKGIMRGGGCSQPASFCRSALRGTCQRF